MSLVQHEELHEPTGIMCSIEFNEGALEFNEIKLNAVGVAQIVSVEEPPILLRVRTVLNRYELEALSWFYTQICTRPDLYVADIA